MNKFVFKKCIYHKIIQVQGTATWKRTESKVQKGEDQRRAKEDDEQKKKKRNFFRRFYCSCFHCC